MITVNNTIRTCSIDGCENVHRARGWCSTHYNRWNKHGDPLHVAPRQFAPPFERFLSQIEVRDSGCIDWVGQVNLQGYGIIYVNGRNLRVHRYIWELEVGPIPEGKVIDHICHNRVCCNVDHLRVVTVTQNNQYLSGAQRGTKSGVRNVDWHKPSQKWRVTVTRNGVRRSYGYFSALDDAVMAAEQARKELFGEFAGRG